MTHAGEVRVAAALSGGGSKGAFQVGVLRALEESGVVIDAFAGVSTGAIQAAAGAMDALADLEGEWRSIKGDADVHRRAWMPWRARYDASPLRDRLQRFAQGRALVKPLRVGVVSLQFGEFQLIDETASDIARWIYASCAIPTEYEPVLDRSPEGRVTQWIDGGVRDVTPLHAAAMKFRPRGVFMIRSHPKPVVKQDGREFRTILGIGMRAIEVLRTEVSLNDLSDVGRARNLYAMRARIESLLATRNVPDDVRHDLLAELDGVLSTEGLVPVWEISPRHEVSVTNVYHPGNIANAIKLGRETVAAQLDGIRAFEASCRKDGP